MISKYKYTSFMNFSLIRKSFICSLFLLFSANHFAQSNTIIGKWVVTSIEYYIDGEMNDSEKMEIDNNCIPYHEYTSDGEIIVHEFNSFCEAKDLDIVKYKYNNNSITIIEEDGNELNFTAEKSGNTLKLIANFFDDDNVPRTSIIYYKNYYVYNRKNSASSGSAGASAGENEVRRYKNSNSQELINEIDNLLSKSYAYGHKYIKIENGKIIHSFERGTRRVYINDLNANSIEVQAQDDSYYILIECKGGLKSVTADWGKYNRFGFNVYGKSNADNIAAKFIKLIRNYN